MADDLELETRTEMNQVSPISPPNAHTPLNGVAGEHKLDIQEETNTEVEPKQTSKDKHEEEEEEDNSNAYCKFVASRHKLAFGITLGLHILMILITVILLASGYDILPIDFADVPLTLESDSSKLRTDAWIHVRDDDSVAKLNGNQSLRSIEYQTISLNYEAKGGNVFTKENLLAIQRNEEEMFKDDGYRSKLCQLEPKPNSTNTTCKMPLSIIRFFDGTYKNANPELYDPNFDKIPTVLNAAQSMNRTKAALNFHLGKDAVIDQNGASTQNTRSLLYVGWPIPGYSSTEDRDDDQAKEVDKIIVDVFATKLEDKYKDGVGDMSFYYNNLALSTDAVQKQVVFDMMLAVASFTFIYIFMWFQTGSLWLTSWGIFSIISSFNITNLVYRIVFDYRYIGIFHVLSIFIILGIGSDNIFVFMDSWKQSAGHTYENLEKRLSVVYRRAAKATLITSFTTMMAFLSNVQSPLLAISSFGLFSAILVIINYSSVIVFYPTVITMYQKSRQGRCCCAPMCGKRDDTTQSRENLADDEKPKKSISEHIIHFFEGWFFRNVITHKISRWVVIAVFLVVVGLSIGFAVKLEPDKEQIKIWKSDTNWGRVRELGQNAYRPSQEDRVVIVHIIWGLKEQDRSECHHTDYKCKGKTVFDRSYDLNPPPCQNAMLDLCHKLKNLPREQEEKLKLRRSQVTGEVETECVFERMNEYLTAEGNKTQYPNGSDFSFPVNSAKMTELMKRNPKVFSFNMSLPDTYYRFFEVGLGYFMTHGGSPNFATGYDYKKYEDLLGGELDPTSVTNERSVQGNRYGNRLLYAGIAVNLTLIPETLGYQNGLPIYDNWEKFVNDEMNNLPSSCNSGFQATVSYYNVWHWLKVQEILVNSAMVGIIIGIVLALVVLTLATTNVIVGVMATITIALITCSVLGMIPLLGWKLGVFESLNLTLIVGLAVDYVVHLAEGYMELEDQDRLTRVRYTLGHVGISVFSGACTTLGASIFMLAAKIIFFSQFGIFIFCTIGFSILYSLFLFTTMLGLIGPEGTTGSLKPIFHKVKDYVRGKSSNHVDCDTCKGKGFHKKDLSAQNTAF